MNTETDTPSPAGSLGDDPNFKLLEWVNERPDWQRDLARRIALSGDLTSESGQEVYDLLKAECGIELNSKPAKPIPLEESHLKFATTSLNRIEVESVSDLSSVGVMDSTQTLKFAEGPGLTIVYGGNGSGKSGYAKVLKRATGSVLIDANDTIRGNVFDEKFDPNKRASATIKVASISDNGTKNFHSVKWEDDDPIPPVLAPIRVFDRDAAGIYATSEHEIAYLPAALEILQKMAEAQAEIHELCSQRVAWNQNSNTTDLACLPQEALEVTFPEGIQRTTSDDAIAAATSWDEAKDGTRLAELERMLESGPAERTRLNRQRNVALSLSKQAELAEKLFSKKALANLNKLIAEREAAREAERLASEEAFADREVFPLPGTGSGAWKKLFEISKEFLRKEAGYQGDFPPKSQKDRCALCQQTLGKEALGRFKFFEDFVTGQASNKARQAESECQAALTPYLELEWNLELAERFAEELSPSKGEGAKAEEVLARYKKIACALITRSEYMKSVKSKVIDSYKSGKLGDLDEISIVSGLLNEFAENCDAQISRIDALDKEDKREAKVLQEEFNNLKARQALAPHKKSISTIRNRCSEIVKLEYAIQQLNTGPVSRAKRRIRVSIFDTGFARIFKQECAQMRVHQDVSVGFREDYGVTQRDILFGVAPTAAQIPMKAILSEGEHRALALAAFFAEVRSVPNNAAVIIDDPVSSLDHQRRQRVAKRVVDLTQKRQVIVFTHDLTFMFDLESAALSRGRAVLLLGVVRKHSTCGIVDSKSPKDKLKVKGRLNDLEQKTSALANKFAEGEYESDELANSARHIGGDIRDAFEHLIEHELLAGVIQRFSTAVQTLRLREVAIPDDLFDLIYAGMTSTNAWSHDSPLAANRPPPEPDDLLEEINRARQSLDLIIDYRKQYEHRPK